MIKKSFFSFLLILLCSWSLIAETPKQIADQINHEFLSPFCPGRSLADCPSKAANDLKKDVLNRIESGQTKDQVMTALETEYGEHLNSLPKMQGFASFAWLIPVIFFFLLFIAFVVFYRRNRKESN